jgi:hypothetical protein
VREIIFGLADGRVPTAGQMDAFQRLHDAFQAALRRAANGALSDAERAGARAVADRE